MKLRAGDYERDAGSGLLLPGHARRKGIERAHPQWMCGPGFFGGSSGPATDPNFSNVVALLHFDGTNGSTTLTDQKSHTFTISGTGALSTTQSKFGGASFLCGSTSTNTCSSAASTDWDMGSGDFTTEGWAWNSANLSTIQMLVGNRTSGGSDRGPLILISSATIRGFCGDSSGTIFGDTTLAGSVPSAAWFHWAYCRSGTSFRMFLNGTQVGTTATSSSSCGGGQALQIGYDAGTTGREWLGYLDDFRHTKGFARYTSNFSVPAAAFPNS